MGPFGSDIKSSYFVNDGVPVIRGGNLLNNQFHDENFVFLTEEKADSLKRSNAYPGDIVFTHRGTLGQVAFIPENAKYPRYVVSQSQMKLTCNVDLVDPKYVYYYFLSPMGQHELLKNTATTGVPAISQPLSSLKKMEIPLPPLPVQKKIAAILSSLDDKIEINTRMNKVLEETARTLFHRWFMEFEFPNDEGKPYKSSGGRMIASEMGEIPEGWSVVELKEIVDVHSGYSYKGSELHESQTALATIKNFDRNGGFKLNGFKEIVPSKKVKSEQYVRLHDIIVAHTDLTQNADVIGNCELLVSTAKYDNIIISMDLVKVVPKKTEINNYFVMSILSNVKFKQHSLGYINGTTVLHLSKSAIPDYKIPLPENMLICMVFGTILENIYTLITKNINENQVILEIRDSLIPKLMNGKVKVI